MQNIMNGPGAQRHSELRSGCRRNGKTYNSGVKRESRTALLGLSNTIHHDNLIEGDLVSIDAAGKVVPLDPSLKFGGIIAGIGEEGRGYFASLIIRGAVSIPVEGFDLATREGAPVYARPGERTQTLSVLEQGGVLVGEVLMAESSRLAIVGIRVPGDARPFEVMGPRPH